MTTWPEENLQKAYDDAVGHPGNVRKWVISNVKIKIILLTTFIALLNKTELEIPINYKMYILYISSYIIIYLSSSKRSCCKKKTINWHFFHISFEYMGLPFINMSYSVEKKDLLYG